MEGPNEEIDLLKSSTNGRLILNYHELQFGPNTVTIAWMYSPATNSSCTASEYEVDVYSPSNIENAESLSDLVIQDSYSTNEENITIATENAINYFRLSAVQDRNTTCAESAYFHQFFYNGALNWVCMDFMPSVRSTVCGKSIKNSKGPPGKSGPPEHQAVGTRNSHQLQ